MVANLRDLSSLLLWPVRTSAICSRCGSRTFTTSPRVQSGHNKWSKIKHQKGKADQIKTIARTQHVQAITLYSKLYGPDPNTNTSLANAIALAKKVNIPTVSSSFCLCSRPHVDTFASPPLQRMLSRGPLQGAKDALCQGRPLKV